MTYKILKASDGRTILVSEDSFEGKPSDYFVGSPPAKIVGEVEMVGDTQHLSDIYESER